MEIGGYIEFEKFNGKMLYDDAIKLNCARNALLYIIKTHDIKKIYIPKYMCDSNDLIYKNTNIDVQYYEIYKNFYPIIKRFDNKDEWIYVVNYFGQLSNKFISSLGSNIIIDNVQAYFQKPVQGQHTFYSCRKFFGVPDGAILYTDNKIKTELKRDKSYDNWRHLLGRYEENASLFYDNYIKKEQLFNEKPLMLMSKLTENILHGLNYEYIKNTRTENFKYLHENLKNLNSLDLTIPSGPFMYPLLIENGYNIRKKLIANKIYIPLFWPNLINNPKIKMKEQEFAQNLLPIPVDQRYKKTDLDIIINCIERST